MEVETQETSSLVAEGLDRLTAAAAHLERTVATLEARFAGGIESAGGEVAKVVAAIETEPSTRLTEIETRLCAAEAQIAELRAQAAGTVAAAAGRKTLPVAAAHLLAKHGIEAQALGTLDQANGGALDAALSSLSLEQRIAVKSQLLRTGLVG